jgi:hypothetical protein
VIGGHLGRCTKKASDLQVDESRFSDIGSDEFRCELDSVEEHCEIASGGSTETVLLSQDVPVVRKGENVSI